MKKLLLAALFLVPTYAAAECTNEWTIEPGLEADESGVTAALNFVFTFGGSAKTECEAELAEMRNQEIENEYDRLELCILAKEAGSPRLIKECKAEGFIE